MELLVSIIDLPLYTLIFLTCVINLNSVTSISSEISLFKK